MLPDDNKIIQAEPQCLDENKKPIVRRCESSEWIPELPPKCFYTHKHLEHSQLCPLGYKAIIVREQSLCFLLIQSKEWENTCFFDGSASVYYDLSADEKTEILNELNAQNVTEVWMPARQFGKYEPVIWTMAGEMYGEIVDFEKIGVHLIESGNTFGNSCLCTIVQANLTVGYLKNCDSMAHVMCVYRKNKKNLMRSACEKNYYAVPYQSDQHYCYSIVNVNRKLIMNDLYENKSVSNEVISTLVSETCHGDLFSMESAQKMEIFMDLAKQRKLSDDKQCLFSVLPENNFIASENSWKNLHGQITFVNWDYPLLNGTYLTVNHKGKWNFIYHLFNCIVCQKHLKYHRPELVLHFEKGRKILHLVIYDEEFLWRKQNQDFGVKCFTNADHEFIKTVSIESKKWSGILKTDHLYWKNSTKINLRERSRVIYELKLYGGGPGYYWCEGHTIFKFERIRSTKVVAFKRLRGDVFATLFNITCEHRCEYMQYTDKHIKESAKNLQKFLKELNDDVKKSIDYKNVYGKTEISIEDVRVMRIEYISKRINATDKQYVIILFHLTVLMEKTNDTKIKERNIKFSDEENVYKLMNVLTYLLQQRHSEKYRFISINSTEYCLSEPQTNGLSWPNAKIGETIPPKELCLLSSGLPVFKSCIGDFLYGGVWKNLTRQNCHRKPDQTTSKLFEIYNNRSFTKDDVHSAIQKISTMFKDNTQSKKILAADLFYLGRIISDLLRVNDDRSNATTTTIFNKCDTQHIFSIYNNLMYLNENTTRRSAALNSTNILLDALDNIINDIPKYITSATKYCNNVIVNSDAGTIATQTPKLIVYVIDPFVKNVSGIALIKKSQLRAEQQNDFRDYSIKTLHANQSTDELLGEDDLEIATFVPTNLLERLNETRFRSTFNSTTNTSAYDNDTENLSPLPPIKIVISVYYNDQLFQEFKNVTYAKTSGKIVSVSIPGYGSNLPGLLPIFIKSRSNTKGYDRACGYWNFESENAAWSQDGCEFGGASKTLKDPIVLCACSHLTHFSYLVMGTYVHSIDDDRDDVKITKIHQRALDMITLLGCSLSLVGIAGIAITAVVFRSWREKPSSIVLLQLSLAIALQMVLLCFVNTEYSSMYLVMEHRWQACVALGALLQYSILVAFSWMLITAYLQFMRYVKVLGAKRSTRFFLKSFLIGWTTPLIPVLIVVLVAPQSYVQNVKILGSRNNGGICYPSGWSLYFGLFLPIGLIICANLIIFILVIYNIMIGAGSNVRSNKQNLMLAQLRLSVFLFFLLGLSWIFGFLASIKAGLIFSYLFCLTATIQGFVLFVYFIILDPSTRKLWQNRFSFCFN